jgi:prolipoprotein diacylglyceryltransferase
VGSHLVFDILAALSAMAVTVLVYHWRLTAAAQRITQGGAGYAVALVAGAVLGGYALGSLNLYLSGTPAAGRSILGALAGAILAVEAFKAARGIRGSTGLIFVAAFATSVAVGRWGCFLSGLEDFTHGVPTALPWGQDYGDGIARHPVQLYESFAMTAFLAAALWALWRPNPVFLRHGFYLMVLWYAAQRFAWEFLKPYAAVAGPFNLFHFVCAALVAYAAVMIARGKHEHAAA